MKRKRAQGSLVVALQIIWITVLSLAVIVLVLLLINALPWSLSWDVWTVLTAVGTVGATLVALILALRSWAQDKNSTARLVSVWVTDKYQPCEDGSSHRRIVHLHVANESSEPVFNAMVNVHIGRYLTPLGPLAAPAPISVVPLRREIVFDISIPLLAHSGSWSPRASLTKGRGWIREPNGGLQALSRDKQRWSKKAGPGDKRQLGDQESLFNPMIVALMFLSGLRDEQTTPDELSVLLAPEATGWVDVNWDELGTELTDFQPTSMVDYPAPRLARVKLLGDKALEGKRVEGNGHPLELDNVKFMTLTLEPHNGWRIFGVGENVPPAAIYFGGSLNEEVDPFVGPIPTGEGNES